MAFYEDYIIDIIIELIRDKYPKLPNEIKDFIEDEVSELLSGYNQSEEQLKEDTKEIIYLSSYNYLEKQGKSDIAKSNIIGYSKYRRIRTQAKTVFNISYSVKQNYKPVYLQIKRKRLTKQKHKGKKRENIQVNINLITKLNNSLFKMKHFKYSRFNEGNKYIRKWIEVKPYLEVKEPLRSIDYKKDTIENDKLKQTILTSIKKLKENELYLSKKDTKQFIDELQAIEDEIKKIERKKQREIRFISKSKLKEYLNDILKNKIIKEENKENLTDRIDNYCKDLKNKKIL